MIQLKKVKEVFKKSDSENSNQQKVVPVGDESEKGNENCGSNKKSLPSSSKFSDLMTKVLGEIMNRSNWSNNP